MLDARGAPIYSFGQMRHRPIARHVGTFAVWRAVLPCLALCLGGCEATVPKPTSPTIADSAQASGAPVSVDVWRPLPKSIRVYPSTRFIQEKGRAILEARFELFDEMGDSVKAPGTFQIELHSIDETLGNVPHRLLYTWNAQTLTLDQQREHYDPIIRGYLFRLGVENLRIAKQATLLKVVFTPVEGSRLEADKVITSGW